MPFFPLLIFIIYYYYIILDAINLIYFRRGL
jgi:hypothetical protein